MTAAGEDVGDDDAGMRVPDAGAALPEGSGREPVEWALGAFCPLVPVKFAATIVAKG